MEEKKYLKWYNKIGYGSGDIAGNVVYAFLTSFMMVYLTDSVGLAAVSYTHLHPGAGWIAGARKPGEGRAAADGSGEKRYLPQQPGICEGGA